MAERLNAHILSHCTADPIQYWLKISGVPKSL